MPTAEELQRVLGPFLGPAFVGDQVLQQFIARCYNIDFLRRGLEEDLAAAKAFLSPSTAETAAQVPASMPPRPAHARIAFAVGALVTVAGAGVVIYLRREQPPAPPPVSAPSHSALAARNPPPPPPSVPAPAAVVPAI